MLAGYHLRGLETRLLQWKKEVVKLVRLFCPRVFQNGTAGDGDCLECDLYLVILEPAMI